jgi:hypothetical protein
VWRVVVLAGRDSENDLNLILGSKNLEGLDAAGESRVVEAVVAILGGAAVLVLYLISMDSSKEKRVTYKGVAELLAARVESGSTPIGETESIFRGDDVLNNRHHDVLEVRGLVDVVL